jgi:hypothetical protein
MASKRRMVLLIVTSLLAAITVLYVQGRFQSSDEGHALGVVQSYRSPAGVSIPDLLAHHHPGAPVAWSAHTESACFQHIRVRADVAGAEPAAYTFVVDINGPAIHPGDDRSRALIAEMDRPLPVADGGTERPPPEGVKP